MSTIQRSAETATDRLLLTIADVAALPGNMPSVAIEFSY